MKKLRVALIYGGRGCEHDVSVMGAKNLLPMLDRKRLTVYPIYIDKKGVWHLGGERGGRIHPCCGARSGAFISDDGRIAVDVALPLLHGDFGEDGRVQGALDCAGIPYVGCGVRSGAVSADKILTKMVADSLGIPTARSVYLTRADIPMARSICEEHVGYPMFIKPSGLGSSVGCTLVSSPDMLDEAISAASGERILIEEYLEGARELECAYSSTSRFGEIFAPPGEVISRGVYTYREKYGSHTQAKTVTRAMLPSGVQESAEEYSRALVRAIGISQIARIDYFLHDGELILNEINTMPGFTQASLYSAMMSECGIEPRELLTALLEDAYDRRF